METQENTMTKKRVRLNPKPKIPEKRDRQGEKTYKDNAKEETQSENEGSTDLWRSRMQKKIEDLSETIRDLKKTNDELKTEN
ncbi:hypothetical protein M0802_015168 [Mischocyttarus mexicanus]|nr:hypothetical protein M0802_015168 [Mischocyttarus mexicanus]